MNRSTVLVTALCAAASMLVPAAAGAAGPLTVAAAPNPAQAGAVVTFTITPWVTASGDSVTFDFGDGTGGTIVYSTACTLFGGCDSIQHAYAGAGTFTVAAAGTAGGNAVAGSVQVTVTGGPADADLFVGTGAHKIGFKNVNWRTDLEVCNPGPGRATYAIALLLRDTDNSKPTYRAQFTLDPGRTVRYPDILATVFGLSEGAAAVRVTPVSGSVLVNSRTYNQLPAGTYGQYVPALARPQAIGWGQNARLIALAHDPSLAAGYRTNLGLVNLSPAPITVQADFYLASGAFIGTLEYDLLPFEFVQTDRAFERVTAAKVDDGYVALKTKTGGAKFLAYASVIDNITGDPTYVPAIIFP